MDPSSLSTIESFGLVTTIVSVFKPYMMDLLNCVWIDNIISEKVRKSLRDFLGIMLGIVIAAAINYFGNYGLTVMEFILIGGGLSYTVGQTAYRVRTNIEGKPLVPRNGQNNGQDSENK